MSFSINNNKQLSISFFEGAIIARMKQEREDFTWTIKPAESRITLSEKQIDNSQTQPSLSPKFSRQDGKAGLYVKYAREHQYDFFALERERDNLLQAIEIARMNKEWEIVHDLWEALDTWLDAIGDWKTLSQLEEYALEANEQLPNREIMRAKVLINYSTYLGFIGQVKAALDCAKRSLELGEKVGDSKTIVQALVGIALIYQNYLDEEDKGHDYLEKAWKICQDIPDWIEAAYVAYQLGCDYDSRGDIVEARKWLEVCIEKVKAVKSSYQGTLYEAYALAYLGNLLTQEGKFVEARGYLMRSLKLRRMLRDQYTIAFIFLLLADLEAKEGKFARAIKLFKKALKIHRKVGAIPAIFNTLRAIGSVYYRQDNNKMAISYYQEFVNMSQEVELPSLKLASAYQRLGWAYEGQEQYTEALEAYRQANQLLDAERNPHFYSEVLRDIGDVYVQQKQFEQALEAYQQALRLLDAERNPHFYGVVLHDIADVYGAQEQFEQALTFYQQAADYKRRGNNPGSLVTTLQAEAEMHWELGQTAEAQQRYERCLALLQGLPAPGEFLLLAEVYHGLGRLHEEQRRYEEALEAYQQALQLLDAEQEPQLYGGVLQDIGDVYQAQGRLEQALGYYQRAAQARVGDPSDQVTTLQALADVQVKLGQTAEALQMLERGVHLLRGLPAPGEPKRLARILLRCGRVYERQRRYEEALEAYQQALQLLDAEQEPQLYGVVLHDMADVYEAQGQLEQALEYYQRAAQAKERIGDPSDLVTTLQALAEVQVELGQESEALQVYEKCLAVLLGLPAPGEPGQLAAVYYGLGQAHEQGEQYEAALKAYQQALQLLDAEQEPQIYGIVLDDIGDVY